MAEYDMIDFRSKYPLMIYTRSRYLLLSTHISLVHFYAFFQCSDLGVFIGAMDENGFAFKSGKLQYNDRVLACNGVDFTKEHTTQQVKDIFYQMAQEPLLRMAISRGVSIPEAYENKPPSASGDGHVTSSEEREIRDEERREEERAAIGRTVDSSVGAGPMSTSASTSVGGASISVGGVSESGTTRGEGTPDPPRSPRICKRLNVTT